MHRMIALSKQLRSKHMALPFIGHSYLFLGNDEDRMNVMKKIGADAVKDGGLVSHWQGSRLYIFVADPVAAELLLKTCLEKDDVVRFFRTLLGNGSIFAPVSIWRPRRKILAPTFSPKNLNLFVQVFARQSNLMVKQLKNVAGNGIFSIWNYLPKYTMDSVCETTLGIQMDAQMKSDLPFLHAFENCCRIDAKRICQPWLYNDKVYKLFAADSLKLHTSSKDLIWDFMNKVIASKWETMIKEKSDTKSDQNVPKESLRTFLELLIDSSGGDKGYSNAELREETLVIVLAGTDTSAVGIAFVTIMLAKYPDIQEKIYQELQEVFGDSDRLLTVDDLPHLKYLEAVIKETLRLYPPVPFIARRIDKDVTLPSGITLVEGCGLFVSIWSMHRNPRYWGDDVEEFRPERFIDTPLKHPVAYIPFSHGPRNCLGYQYAMMSMKTALATLLRQYRVSCGCEDYKRNELRVKFDIMMKDVNGFVVKLDLRK